MLILYFVVSLESNVLYIKKFLSDNSFPLEITRSLISSPLRFPNSFTDLIIASLPSSPNVFIISSEIVQNSLANKLK
jgi:hypothetical protein